VVLLPWGPRKMFKVQLLLKTKWKTQWDWGPDSLYGEGWKPACTLRKLGGAKWMIAALRLWEWEL
jgi:hypothetical protein